MPIMPWVLTGRFLFQSLLYYILVSVLVSAFYFQVPCRMPYPQWGLNHWGLHHCNPLEFTPWQAYVQCGNGHQPTPGMQRVAAPFSTLSRGSLMLLSLLFPSHPIYMMGHTALGAWQRVTQPSAFPTWWGGVFFSIFGSI